MASAKPIGSDLIDAIKSLPGWDRAAHPYADRSPLRESFGELLSTMILATSGGSGVVTVGGELDDNGVGYIAAITESTVVSCQVGAEVTPSRESARVALHALSDVRALTVDARHNHYEDNWRDIHSRMEFSVAVGDETLTFRALSSGGPELLRPEAVLAGFSTIVEKGL